MLTNEHIVQILSKTQSFRKSKYHLEGQSPFSPKDRRTNQSYSETGKSTRFAMRLGVRKPTKADKSLAEAKEKILEQE